MASVTDEVLLDDSPPSVDPYHVLGLDHHVTADQVKTAYRKQALKHHPDKANPEDKATAHVKFQNITFSYAILSDVRRRSRYDATGNISESLDDDENDFNWRDFFRSQKAELMDGKAIQRIKDEYQRSADEAADLLVAFEKHEGDMDAVYGEIMCSNVLEDDKRFRNMIDNAIKNEEVTTWEKYKKETAPKKRVRLEKAKKEEVEAREYAEELGVADQIFGSGKKKDRKADDNSELTALIKQRQTGRSESFLDNLEAKYGGKARSPKKGTKRTTLEEPPEEAFKKNRKKQARS